MSEKKLEIFIITPDADEASKYKFHGLADMVILRCRTGDMGILPGREACSAILDEGALRVIGEDGMRKIAVLGGVFQFENNVLTVITQEALLPGEIDIAATEIQIQDYEACLVAETSASQRDRLRVGWRRSKMLLDVATG